MYIPCSFFHIRTSPNLSPCIHSPHDHSAVGHDDVDDFIQDKAASPPPAVSPLQRTPTPLAAKSPPPQQAPTASPPPPPMPTPAASSALIGPSRNKSPTGPQRSVQPMPKKQAVVTKIPKMTKLSYEKTDKELEASVKSDVQAFFEKTKATTRAKQEKPFLLYPRSKLKWCRLCKTRSLPLVKSSAATTQLRAYYHKNNQGRQKDTEGRERGCTARPTSATISAATSGLESIWFQHELATNGDT